MPGPDEKGAEKRRREQRGIHVPPRVRVKRDRSANRENRGRPG